MRGSLAEFTLNHLLQLFGIAERSGSIDARSGATHAQLHIEVGRVTGLSLDDFNVREALLACELLPATSRAGLLDITPRAETPGLSMLARNAVEPERWDAFVQRLLEQHVYPLLNREEGDFEVTIGRCDAPDLRLAASIQQIILDASRWEAELEALTDTGYAVASVWQRSANGDSHGRFSGTQWLVWAIVCEPLSIATAARRLCLPELAAATAIKQLHALGALERAPN